MTWVFCTSTTQYSSTLDPRTADVFDLYHQSEVLATTTKFGGDRVKFTIVVPKESPGPCLQCNKDIRLAFLDTCFSVCTVISPIQRDAFKGSKQVNGKDNNRVSAGVVRSDRGHFNSQLSIVVVAPLFSYASSITWTYSSQLYTQVSVVCHSFILV